MSTTFWQYLPGIIAAVFSGIAAVIGAINHQKATAVEQKVTQLDVKVDGRLTQLIEQTARASHSAGFIEGQNGATPQ